MKHFDSFDAEIAGIAWALRERAKQWGSPYGDADVRHEFTRAAHFLDKYRKLRERELKNRSRTK